MIRAILLDLGGVVFNEDTEYAVWTDLLLAELRRAGVPVSAQEFTATVEEEIIECEPNPWLAAIWRWVRPDLVTFRAILEKFRAHNEAFQQGLPGVFVRPEAREIIPKLAEQHPLALAANQPPKALELLAEAGLLEFFRWKEISATMGVAKPHPLFFRVILDGLGVKPEEAVMVGDRLDHDIFPARKLGLWAVRVQLGPYARQRGCSPWYQPHACISSLLSLPAVLEELG